MDTVITGIICPLCKSLIYSLSHHDFRYCKCEAVFIDGGREYTRVGHLPGLQVRWVDVEFRDNQVYSIRAVNYQQVEE